MTTKINQPGNANNPREHCRQCPFKSPLFKLLTEEELGLMDQSRQEVIYHAGETIFKQGSPLTHVLSFNSGLAKMQVEGPNESRIILRLVKPVEFICGMGLFSDQRNQFSLIALERSSVCYIRKDNFIEVLHRNKKFMGAFLQHLEHFQAANLIKLLNITQKHATGRVASSLLYLAGEVYNSESYDSHLSAQDLADLAGISKESTFKVLNDLSSQGIISRDGSLLSIRDRALLEKISKNG